MSSAPSTPSKLMDTGHDEAASDDFKHQNYHEDTVVLLGWSFVLAFGLSK